MSDTEWTERKTRWRTRLRLIWSAMLDRPICHRMKVTLDGVECRGLNGTVSGSELQGLGLNITASTRNWRVDSCYVHDVNETFIRAWMQRKDRWTGHSALVRASGGTGLADSPEGKVPGRD